jgi:hypothetical protein
MTYLAIEARSAQELLNIAESSQPYTFIHVYEPIQITPRIHEYNAIIETHEPDISTSTLNGQKTTSPEAI